MKTNITKKLLIEEYINQQKTIKEIANKLGYSRSFITKKFKEFDISTRSRKEAYSLIKNKYKILIDKETLHNEYVIKRRSTIKIAKEYNCNYTTIVRKLKKYYISMRNSHEIHLKNKNISEYRNYNWLHQKYITENLSSYEISNIINVSANTIRRWLKEFNISVRKITEHTLMNPSSIQYKNYEWLYQKYIIEKFSAYKISELIKVDASTIRDWLRLFNIPVRTTSEAMTGLFIGENGSNWKGGITPLNYIIRHCAKYNFWRTEIFKRDNYTCLLCSEKVKY